MLNLIHNTRNYYCIIILCTNISIAYKTASSSRPTKVKVKAPPKEEIPSFRINYSRMVAKNFAKLRHDHTTSDIILEVGSKYYHTHKLVLCNVSPVFGQMFNGKWKESNENRATLDETEQCQKVFDIFLDYAYGCRNGFLPMTISDVVPLLTLADKYEVNGLKGLCSKFMQTLVEGNIKQAITWMQTAEELQLESVLQRCYEVICWNLKQAFQMIADVSFIRISTD